MAETGELIAFPSVRAPTGVLSLDRLLRPLAQGREFADRAIPREVLDELHALMAVSPGATGASPTRVLFVTSPAAKARLARHLPPRARDMAVLAPACAVVAYDRDFAEQLIAFVGDGAAGEPCLERPGVLRATAMRNSVLQGAYLALSARALGLEAAFVRGFDGTALAAEFFRTPGLSAIFLAALGYPPDTD
jgi:nitroreductase